MDSITQEKLFEEFAAILGAGGNGSGASALVDQMTQIGAMRGTKVSGSSSTASAGTAEEKGGGVADTALSVASTVFESGLGVIPLISGLVGLFGGGDKPEPPPLVKYAMPASIAFQAAESGSGFGYSDYDQMGRPRAFVAESGAASAPQITVNVSAMDARSFLDRSSDIAAAVREAMLNLSSINDVVNDL